MYMCTCTPVHGTSINFAVNFSNIITCAILGTLQCNDYALLYLLILLFHLSCAVLPTWETFHHKS